MGRDGRELTWPTGPPDDHVQKAKNLLIHLGCIDKKGQILEHGKNVLSLGLEPRLGHMVLRAKELGLQSLALDLASYLLERETSAGRGKNFRGRAFNSDVCLFLEALHDYRKLGGKGAKSLGFDPLLTKSVNEASIKLKKRFLETSTQMGL